MKVNFIIQLIQKTHANISKSLAIKKKLSYYIVYGYKVIVGFVYFCKHIYPLLITFLYFCITMGFISSPFKTGANKWTVDLIRDKAHWCVIEDGHEFFQIAGKYLLEKEIGIFGEHVIAMKFEDQLRRLFA